jgi:hypothetical protein
MPRLVPPRVACAARLLAVALLLTAPAAGLAVPARAAELTGWGDFRFGMTSPEVQRIAGTAAADVDMAGIPIVSWVDVVFGEKVEIVAFLPNGKLEAINIALPDMANSSERECFARLTGIVEELTRVHGLPDERSPEKVSDQGASTWHAIFRFDKGAVITARSTLTDFDETCSSELVYDSTP